LPAEITLSAQSGTATGMPQSLIVRTLFPSLPFSITNDSGGWLQASTTSGRSPASVQIFADASNLRGGKYNATLTLSTPVPSLLGTVGSTTFQQAISVLVVVSPRPTITAVVNAASFASGPISPGEIITIEGGTLGPAVALDLALDQTGKVSTSLGGVGVVFLPSGAAAPLTYVSSSQINAVVPYEIAGPTTSLQLSYAGQTSEPYVMNVASNAPGIFTLNGSGTGPAAILNQDGTVNSPSNPAAKGSYGVLYATGECQTSPPGVTGEVTSLLPTPPPVTPQPLLAPAILIGGQGASVAFYGEAPGLVSGVLQINAQIPMAVQSGNLPIEVVLGGNSSQSGVTVSVK